MMVDIDLVLNWLAHPFFMVLLGILFTFSLKWSINRNKAGVYNFWDDQKDEIVVSIIGGLIFLIWDDEIIQMYYDFSHKTGYAELKPYYYLLVGPAVERIYKVYEKLSA